MTFEIEKAEQDIERLSKAIDMIKQTIAQEESHIETARMFSGMFGNCDNYKHHVMRANVNRKLRRRLIQYFNNVSMDISLHETNKIYQA